jgi:hypothetical protein
MFIAETELMGEEREHPRTSNLALPESGLTRLAQRYLPRIQRRLNRGLQREKENVGSILRS